MSAAMMPFGAGKTAKVKSEDMECMGGDAAAVTTPKVPRVERLLDVLRRCSAGSLRLAMTTIASSVQYDKGS
ncbi:hypothetical protein N7519_007763 [Penicillium mononematosum]|uniref:uncharacterized protein n=1 Tax=Penicillium mononematosum TaxID=268346 RepID=UPI002547C87E|nr:uncharacterized protein N7519_007763 [Penicillium mononematosum]KAJ6186462.1 hypothetical protein N7519_007763 [Penicillium mononematosum]